MNRYYWIMMTYLTRSMIWLAALAAVTCLVFALCAQSNRYRGSATPIIIADLPIIETKSDFSEFADRPDRVQVRLGRVLSADREKLTKQIRASGTTGSLHVTNDDLSRMVAGLQDFRFPKNVEALNTGGLGGEFIDQIEELENLRRLGFDFSYTGKPFDLSFLSGQKKLEVLELSAIHRIDSLSPLCDLPRLHTLTIDRQGVITKERMAEVANIPTLKNLYLADLPDDALVAISELERSRSLENIFIAVPLGDSDRLAQIQSRVPSIQLRSSYYRPYRLLIFAGSIWFALGICFKLGIHLGGQLSTPQAELAPQYRNSHRRFAWALLATLALVFSGILSWITGAHFLPFLSAFGLAVVTSAKSGLSFAVMSHRPKDKQPSQLKLFAHLSCVVFVIGFGFWLFRHPIVLEEFLMGRRPWAAVALSVSVILVALKLNRRMNGLCRERYEAGLPLAFSMRDVQKASAERAIAGANGAKGKVNPQAPFEAVVRGLGVVVILLVIARMLWGDQIFGTRGVGEMLKGQIVLGSFVLAFTIVFIIGAKWWQRMPFLATMMTRPPNRQTQVNSVMSGVRKDFLLQLPPFVIALMILAVNAPFWGTEHMISRVIASILFIAGTICVCYVAVLWGLIIRTIVGLVVLAMILQFGVTISAALLTITGVDFDAGIPPYRVIVTAVVMTGLAGIAYQIARKKYLTLEWGRLL